MLYQFLSTLSAIFNQKIVFKDVRSENIYIDLEGNTKLVDFGVTKILEEEKNLERMVEYTGDNKTPEFIEKWKYDIFSLGVVVNQMLMGGIPFEVPELNL